MLTAFAKDGRPPLEFRIDVECPDDGRRRDYTYSSIPEFRAHAPTLDRESILSISISAHTPQGRAPIDDQRIDVNFNASPRTAVLIHVSAPAQFEQFVVAADDRVNKAVERNELPMPRLDWAVDRLSVLFGLAATFTLAFADETQWLVLGLALALAAVGVLFVKRAVRWIFPSFELLEEGGTTRTRLVVRRTGRVLAALVRPAYPILLGAVIGLLVSRLVD